MATGAFSLYTARSLAGWLQNTSAGCVHIFRASFEAAVEWVTMACAWFRSCQERGVGSETLTENVVVLIKKNIKKNGGRLMSYDEEADGITYRLFTLYTHFYKGFDILLFILF